MAAKKTTRAKAKLSGAKIPTRSEYEFPCPNPGRPLSLEALIRRMQKDEEFAEFIHALLCDSYSGNKEKAKAAKACLDSYYKLTPGDLTALCIPKSYLQNADRCTVPGQNLLLAVPAAYFAREEKYRS